MLITCLLSANALFAQDFVDLANVYFRHSPANSSSLGMGDVEFLHFAADAKVPVPINENNIVITGIEYNKSWFIFNTTDTSFQPLTSYGLQTGIEHKWNDRFKTLFMVMNRWNGDFDDKKPLGRYHQLGGAIFNTYKRTDAFSWKYGLYFNNEKFAPMFVPLFGFNWKINERWQLNMTIPINLEFSCKINSRLRYGLRFDGVNASYLLRDLGQDFYIDRADNNVWLFSDIYLTKNLVFHLKAGHSIIRKYRYFDLEDKMLLKLGPVNLGDDRNDGITEQVWFKDGWSFEARLIFRLPLTPKDSKD